MAYDEGLAQILRDALDSTDGIIEKKMFGGMSFMLNGNMLCGVHKGGAMFRVGKENEAAAMAVEGTSPLAFTGKKMGGLLDVSDECLINDTSRDALLALAFNFVGALPAK
ncbi:MAG: TfoX/Sxy family protein [Rhodobacteraceae bacterium]|nr:TfoX/Sxy family protein [Paracoccaceae bacterium]